MVAIDTFLLFYIFIVQSCGIYLCTRLKVYLGYVVALATVQRLFTIEDFI